MLTGFRSALKRTARSTMCRFAVAGVINTAVDLLIFDVYLLLFPDFGSQGIMFAKCFGFIGASICSYVLNGQWTFSGNALGAKNYIVFLAVSVTGLIVNVLVAYGVYLSGMGSVVHDRFLVANVAFLCATGASLVVNYLGYRYIVFKQKDRPSEQILYK